MSAVLTVALDIRDPFSYLALQPAFDFVDKLGITVAWLPIRGHALQPPSTASPTDDRGIRHRRARAEMIAREIAVYADAQGLTIESPYRDGPADALYGAWLWVGDLAPEHLRRFLVAAFRSYWANSLDPTSGDDVGALFKRLALDREGFCRWAAEHGQARLQALRSTLTDVGVEQAPAYVVNGEVFYGRQHLAMIRWRLQGESGAPPI